MTKFYLLYYSSLLPESESAKLVMVVMVMIFIVVMLVMVIRTDRKNRTSGTDRQKFLWCFIHGIVWITHSTWEERERLSNRSFVGTIGVKGGLDKKEAIKDLQKITSKEEPKMLEWVLNKELPYWSRWWRSQTNWRRRPRSSTSSSRRMESSLELESSTCGISSRSSNGKKSR